MQLSDLCWLAGIVEGEGCINISRTCVLLQVQMTDEDVVVRAAAVMGVTAKRGGLTKAGKRVWIARVFNEPALAILADIYEQMGTRRKAKIVEAMLTRARQRVVMGDVCRRGHPLVFPETYTIEKRSGRAPYKKCKRCRLDASRENRRRRVRRRDPA